MKRINQYKKLFNVEGNIELSDIKKTYRNLVKEWHPDKFPEENEKSIEAEGKSREIIEAYHFLVSIAPETLENNLEDYNAMLASSAISDFHHKGRLLEVTFNNGNTYEYFGVSEKLFSKFVNADKQFRFAKRNIFNSFLYRKSKKDVDVA